jgi:hypothetical protein
MAGRGAGGAISWRCVVGLFLGSWGRGSGSGSTQGRRGGVLRVEGPNGNHQSTHHLGLNIALFFIPEGFCLVLISCVCALLIQAGW